MNYADQVMSWLKEFGYTHCFFVAGGNSMHLLNSARQQMTCVPFVHEVSAGIAAEYFNEAKPKDRRAFVLVTAGPGMTNLVTALAGSFLESRELLVIGGQVKSTDLSSGGLRQRGIQEIDGVSIASPVTKHAFRIETPASKQSFLDAVVVGRIDRPGPVFIEFCLDAQGSPALLENTSHTQIINISKLKVADVAEVSEAVDLVKMSHRPILLLGGGITRQAMSNLLPLIESTGIPVMTTWNGADRISADHPQYFGRPNTWGQRFSNILIQKSDLLIAAGTRLGLQQTGFNWQEFVSDGKIIHIDIDVNELVKGHPKTDLQIQADADDFVYRLLNGVSDSCKNRWLSWIDESSRLKNMLPLSEPINGHHDGYVNPYDFVLSLSELCDEQDLVIPCSSGGAFTVMMQAFKQKEGQTLITDKGLASMGYGLAGAIGASLAYRDRRTVLVEGDGGFAQNLQELATVNVQSLNLKMFIFSNEGYASIRMTQRNYFDGAYLGCDTKTGLGFPDWGKLAEAYGIRSLVLNPAEFKTQSFVDAWENAEPCLFIVPIHPEQTYFPKISSQVTSDGGMVSAPLHKMTPEFQEKTYH